MSGWTFETDEVLAPSRAVPSGKASATRRVFFAGSDDEQDGVVDRKKRDSHALNSRRMQQNARTELVVDDSDESEDKVTPTESLRMTLPVKDTTTKADEIASADIVRRPSIEKTKEITITSHYVHWLVRDFLEKKYPPTVVAIFDKENPVPTARSETHQAVQILHTQIIQGLDKTHSSHLELALVAWDARNHNRSLERSRSRRRDTPTDPLVAPSTSSTATSSKSKTSRKKPQLSVTIASDSPLPSGDDGEFNRLNHPGHTPKAQDALLAAVIGEPGSTPKTSAGELKMLGFDDLDDESSSALIPTPRKPDTPDDSEDDDDDDGLSKYAKRKRAAQRHNKHVYIGEPGGTPTKEYVFFRETPPRFVTETIEDAKQILRSIGGNPEARRQQLMAAAMERFVELQSSDVAKYKIGQQVENLGAQRNVSGLISKLYGSRQCGSAGPGTVVIDTWYGSDTAPIETESLSVASRPSTPASRSQ